MITATIIFYNDELDIFEKTLQSLKRFNVPSVAIDGSYKEFPHDKFYSTNGALELVRKYCDYVIECPPWGWENQAQKRNMTFKVVPQDSYVMTIDADEELIQFDLPELTENHYITFNKEPNGDLVPYIRIHKVVYDLQYLYSHFRLYRLRQHDPSDPESGVVTKASGPINNEKTRLPGVVMLHNRQLRSESRKEQKNIYYRTRNEMLNNGKWPKQEMCPKCIKPYYGNLCPYCKG